MEVNTTINVDADVSFEIDADELFSEMESSIHASFEHFVGDYGLQDYDEVNSLIDEKVHDIMAEYAESIQLMTYDNVEEMINTAIDDDGTDTSASLYEIRNELEKTRRSVRVLLEEREARLGMRIKRATHNIKGSIGRKVRQIKGRLTRKD